MFILLFNKLMGLLGMAARPTLYVPDLGDDFRHGAYCQLGGHQESLEQLIRPAEDLASGILDSATR